MRRNEGLELSPLERAGHSLAGKRGPLVSEWSFFQRPQVVTEGSFTSFFPALSPLTAMPRSWLQREFVCRS
ncbi:MAG: hypothetical protein L0191_21225 [Acidobacteria bacterium]|nr:hypothetical protein [Acidobacteriota bacterium]